MKTVILSVCILGLVTPAGKLLGACWETCVETNAPLYYGNNPVDVQTVRGQEIDLALREWETVISGASGCSWSLFVGDSPEVPSKVLYGAERMSCVVRYDAGRIVSFTIYWNISCPWCFDTGPYPTSCVPGTYGFYDGMMHEVGHAIGLGHCANICDCEAFRALPANVQIEAMPTMVGGVDVNDANCHCDGLACGYISPANLDRSLAAGDNSAVAALYLGVVRIKEPIRRVERNGQHVRCELAEELCGFRYSVMMSDSPSAPGPVVGSGAAEVAAGGRCELIVNVGSFQEGAYVWLCNEVSHTWYGPARVEETDGSSMPDGKLKIVAMPNPFNPTVEIRVAPGTGKHGKVAIYDVWGRLVFSVYSGELPRAGMTCEWPGRGDDGRDVASGEYIISVIGEDVWATQKISLVR